MSRLDKLGEILEGAEQASGEEQQPKMWRHIYETYEEKHGEIITASKIKGRLVYDDPSGRVKVSYAGQMSCEEGDYKGIIDELQVQYSTAENPESLEALVTLSSDDMFNKDKLTSYVENLHKIEEECNEEKGDFAKYRTAFNKALQEVIKKILELGDLRKLFDAYDGFTDLYDSNHDIALYPDLAKDKLETHNSPSNINPIFTPGLGSQGGLGKYIQIGDDIKEKYTQIHQDLIKNIIKKPFSKKKYDKKEEYYSLNIGNSKIEKLEKEDIKEKYTSLEKLLEQNNISIPFNLSKDTMGFKKLDENSEDSDEDEDDEKDQRHAG